MTTSDPTQDGGTAAAPFKAHPPINATIAIAAIVIVALGLRPSIVSIGPILPNIISEFGLSHAVAALMTSIPDVLMGLLALPTPWLARRFGRDPVLLAALVLLGVSTVARAQASTTVVLLAWTAGVGAGIALAGALIAGFIKARFPGHAAALMGIYATALSLGSTISAGATGTISMSEGWRFSSGVWGGVVFVGILAWMVITALERRQHAVVGVAQPPHSLPLANPKAWLVALFFACVNLLFYAILAWTSPLYQEGGLSPTKAGLVLATFTAVFTIANPIFGTLSRNDDRRFWLAVAAALTVAGLVPLAIAPLAAPFVFVPLCAFGLGGAFTLGMTLPLDNTRSVNEANVWNAFVLTVGYLIAAAGPLFVGQLRDLTGSFHLSLWVLAAIAGFMLVLTPFLGPNRR